MRWFNHAAAMKCLNHLATRTEPAGHRKAAPGLAQGASKSEVGPASGYRILMVGISNMLHIWHMMQPDDGPRWEPFGHRRTHPSCRPVPERSLRAFAPHAVDFSAWQVVTPPASGGALINKVSSSSCYRTHAIGGGFLENLVAIVQRPYDVVAVHVGAWDASFTKRNTSGFEGGLAGGVRALLSGWPTTRVVLLTMTPCGGLTHPSGKGRLSLATPTVACEWVRGINDAMRRVAAEHSNRTVLLDAHQMTVSRPLVNSSQQPPDGPGIWMAQNQGWHFNGPGTPPSARADMRANNSASGEMTRAFANRLWDVICP